MEMPWLPVLKRATRFLLPPFIVFGLRRLGHVIRGVQPEWEYVPDGWRSELRHASAWSHASVKETLVEKWPVFVELTRGTGPLGIAHEAPTLSRDDPDAHHLVMAFGYVLARAARGRDRVSVLDWGGGLGHYLVLSRCLVPEVEIRYTCLDLPHLCETGRALQDDAHFIDAGEAIAHDRYDLVLASGSLQCVEDWKLAIQQLAQAAGSYLYITRLPVIEKHASFVALQRAHSYGYRSEFLNWMFNRDELLVTVAAAGLTLEREFVFHRLPVIARAPEQADVRGFLFRRGTAPATNPFSA
jgi:putative methyltransferase (TIGR04325 family)